MKYLKKFEQHSDYETFRGGVEYITPNVSVCVNEDEVHYNPYYDNPILKFTAEEANSTIKLNRVGTATTLANASLQYSVDNGETWNDYTFTQQGTKGYSGDTITLENVSDSVRFKGTNTTLGVNSSNRHQFVMTGKIKASGDITSLFNEVGGDFSMPDYGCYRLFYGCTSLTSAPALPATTMLSYCYSNMFNGCTSLTAAPELPATTLASNCYDSMFAGCTSLTAAPALPATTLKPYCYFYMFRKCTSLTKAPELPATTLVNHCYSVMFDGCSKLSYIKAMFTTTPSLSYTDSWVSDVASSGTFVKNAAATWTTTGVYGIPNGWEVETATA